MNTLDLNIVCTKNGSLEKKEKSSTILLSFLVFIVSLPPQKKNIKNSLHYHFSTMGPCLFLPEHLFSLSHRKTRWTLSMDNVVLKKCLLETSNSTVTLTFVPSV
jgi:hypothetical protein